MVTLCTRKSQNCPQLLISSRTVNEKQTAAEEITTKPMQQHKNAGKITINFEL